MKQVPLLDTNGNIVTHALVSDEDFEKASALKWHQHIKDKKIYAEASYKNTILPLHHLIIGKPPINHVVDHINGNSLDNTRQNLRFATYSQNSQNRNLTNKVGYIGIRYNEKKKTWRACCKKINLGTFKLEIEAAKAYDKCAFVLFGKYAKTNGLIKYEDVTETLEDIVPKKVERDLPKNITIRKGVYYAQKEYKTTFYSSKGCKTVEEAKIELVKILDKIDKLIKNDKKTPVITRDENNNVVIQINKINIIVDEDKWEDLCQYTWFIDAGYARTNINGKVVHMHRYLMQANDGDIIDHININSLDNRICNLRLSCAGKNNHNKRKKENCTSIYFGVCKRKNGKFEVKIKKDKIKYHVGTYNTEVEAALAYNKKAEELYGTFARLNVIEPN